MDVGVTSESTSPGIDDVLTTMAVPLHASDCIPSAMRECSSSERQASQIAVLSEKMSLEVKPRRPIIRIRCGLLLRINDVRKRFVSGFIRGRSKILENFKCYSGELSDCMFDWPWIPIGIFFFVALALSSGFFVATMEEDVYMLYSLPESQSVEHAKTLSVAYPELRANFIMFNNSQGEGQLFDDLPTMAALWAVDNFIRRKMVVPRLHFSNGLAPEHHIWNFLDSDPDLDQGYMRFPDVCALRPELNRGLEQTEYHPRLHSQVFSDEWTDESALTPAELESESVDVPCDFHSAMSVWRNPLFRPIRTRNYPFFPIAWYQRAVDLDLLFFHPTLNYLPNPKPDQPPVVQIEDAQGLMAIYYTDYCPKGKACDAIVWERALVDLINGIRKERQHLYDDPQSEPNEPLVWIDSFGQVVKSNWVDIDVHCTGTRGLNVDSRGSGSIICDLENQPEHALILSVRSLELAVYGAGSWSDELARSTAFDLELMLDYVASFIILLIFGSISMCTRNIYRTKILVGMAASINGLLGYVAGAGICYLFGLRHTATMNAVPFLAMGIAMDDAFVMMNAYTLTYYLEAKPRRRKHYNELNDTTDDGDDRDARIELSKRRCRLALIESSIAITLTTMTNLVSFSVGIASPYSAASNFCIICVCGLLGGYIGAFFFLWPVVCLMARFEILRPEMPTMMTRILPFFNVKKSCPVPVKIDGALNADDYTTEDVIAINARVTERQYRVIRLRNELARREFVQGSVNLTLQLKALFHPPESTTAAPELPLGSFASSNQPTAGSPLPPAAMSLSDLSDEAAHSAHREAGMTGRQNDDTRMLECLDAILPDLTPSIISKSESPTRALLRNISFDDQVQFPPSECLLDRDHQTQLESLLMIAKRDYDDVKPPPGTLNRGARSVAVRITTTFMRTKWYRWAVVILFSCFLTFMVYQISVNFEKGLEQLYLVPNDSYLNDSYAMSTKNEIYLIESQLGYFVKDGIRFSDPVVRELYTGLLTELKSKDYISRVVDPIAIFEVYLEKQIGKPRLWNIPEEVGVQELFDGSFSEVDSEWERALLYWNLKRSDGNQMSKYLVWSSIPDSYDESIEDDIPWTDPEKANLSSVMAIYFNKFYPDVSDQSLGFRDWRDAVLRFNQSNDDTAQAVEYNSLHPFFESDDIILRQTLLSMGGALIGIGVVTALLMNSHHILHPNSILVVGMIILMDVAVFGTMAMFGIKLNIITMILLVMSIGFSVDYSLHTAHQYIHMPGNLLERLTLTMIFIGLPLFQGLSSTLLAATPLFTRLDEYIFATFLKMIIIVLIIGFTFGVLLLPQVLIIIDRLKGDKEAFRFSEFVDRFLAELKIRDKHNRICRQSGLEDAVEADLD